MRPHENGPAPINYDCFRQEALEMRRIAIKRLGAHLRMLVVSLIASKVKATDEASVAAPSQAKAIKLGT